MKFGDFVLIEQWRYKMCNENYRHKVIGTFQSNSYVNVPVRMPRTETLHDKVIDVIACVCCGVNERVILNYPKAKVKLQ